MLSYFTLYNQQSFVWQDSEQKEKNSEQKALFKIFECPKHENRFWYIKNYSNENKEITQRVFKVVGSF